MTLPDDVQEQFYSLSGQAQEAVSNNDLDTAFQISIKAMKMCTTDAYTEYTLARIYQTRSNCAPAFYHLSRLFDRVKSIATDDPDLAKEIKKHYKEAKDTCGNAVPIEITCATPETKVQLTNAIDTPMECPIYTRVMPGAYPLIATRDKFFPHKDTFTVSEEGGTYTVPSLKDAEDFGDLRVKCPRGAIKFILTDARNVVNEYSCPWEGRLPSGTYKIRLGGTDVGSEMTVTVSKQQQTEHIIPSEVKSNCSTNTKNSATGFGALVMTMLGTLGLATLRRRRREN